MNILHPRPDFVIVEEFFSPEQAASYLSLILKKGEDPLRGFHHPLVRPNRFHAAPKYPVKKFMCFGLYWNPLDYVYYPKIPQSGVKPHPVPAKLAELSKEILAKYYQWQNFSPEAALVNFYTKDSSMGLHVDKDEEDQTSPVIGLNFGSACRFFYEDEKGEMQDLRIPGNSIYIFGRSARLMRHGLGSIYANTLSGGSETFLESKERVNITIRQIYSSPT
jgi:alkylated DNA repair protein (DNA oxidative demethylase)